MAAPSDMAKLTKFARKRPIARQRPFDVTFLTRDEFSAGDPVFMSDDVTFTGTGAFSVVKSARHVRKYHACAAHCESAETIAKIVQDIAGASAEAGTWSPMFVGLCVTEGTRLQQSTAPGRIGEHDGYRSIPTTIAGNQTMSMDAFMYLLGLRMVLDAEDRMHVFDDFDSSKSDARSAAMGKLVEDKMIHAGTRIVIGNKVLRLIETVMMDGHHKSTSVSVILSSLSD